MRCDLQTYPSLFARTPPYWFLCQDASIRVTFVDQFIIIPHFKWPGTCAVVAEFAITEFVVENRICLNISSTDGRFPDRAEGHSGQHLVVGECEQQGPEEGAGRQKDLA